VSTGNASVSTGTASVSTGTGQPDSAESQAAGQAVSPAVSP
jgi:hypothetical protein